MSRAEQTAYSQTASEVEFQTKLNVPSRSGCRNLAERGVGGPAGGSKSSVTEIRRSEVGAIEGVEHVRLKPQVESLGDPKLFAHREVPGLQVGTLDNSHRSIAATPQRRRGKSRGIDPAVRARIGQQDRTT